MNLMVAEYRPLVVMLFPLVSLGGMLQLNTAWTLSRVATTAIPEPTMLQLFCASLIYPVFVAAFLRLDGAKLAFQVSTIIFISAILGIVVYPLLLIPLSMFIAGVSASPWFALTVLLLDLGLAVGFLFALGETDFHKLSGGWILGSLTAFEVMAVVIVLYATGTLHKWWAFVSAKAMALMGGM